MVLKGHCLCKAVTYTVDVDAPLITAYDHCDDCQRQSGSTYCKPPPPFFFLCVLLLVCPVFFFATRLPTEVLYIGAILESMGGER